MRRRRRTRRTRRRSTRGYEEGEDEEEEQPVFEFEEEEGDERVWDAPDEYVEPEYTGMPREPRTREPYQRDRRCYLLWSRGCKGVGL